MKNQSEDIRIYGAELVVYDKHQRCLLTDGEYQLVLQDLGQKSSPKKLSSWESFPEGKEKTINLGDVFGKGPLVTFHLQWKDNLINGTVDRPLPTSNADDLLGSNHLSDIKSDLPLQEKGKKTRIFYQFLYNNNTRQQTEARDDFQCPWCCVNCIELYCLLKHLKLCHSRFIFNYVPVIRPPDIFGLPRMPELPPTPPMFHHYIPVLPRHVNARIEDSAQKNESQKRHALDECLLRLNQAAELYKKQFRKIEKLKKKLRKSSSDFMDSAQKNESQKQHALDECLLCLNEAAELYKKQFRKIEKLKKKLSKSSYDFMKDSAQKNESQKQYALDECLLRLNEAAELYKKQFRKIEKLKKKLSKSSYDFMACPECKEDMLNVHIICHDVG